MMTPSKEHRNSMRDNLKIVGFLYKHPRTCIKLMSLYAAWCAFWCANLMLSGFLGASIALAMMNAGLNVASVPSGLGVAAATGCVVAFVVRRKVFAVVPKEADLFGWYLERIHFE